MHGDQSNERDPSESATDTEPAESGQVAEPIDPNFSTARALLKHVGTWQGDDWEELLVEVYAMRIKTTF